MNECELCCLCEECPADTSWRPMKVWWWCRSWRTDSRSTLINWSTSVCRPWTCGTLYQRFASLSSSLLLCVCGWAASHVLHLILTEQRRYETVHLWARGLARTADQSRGDSTDEHGRVCAGAPAAFIWLQTLNTSFTAEPANHRLQRVSRNVLSTQRKLFSYLFLSYFTVQISKTILHQDTFIWQAKLHYINCFLTFLLLLLFFKLHIC